MTLVMVAGALANKCHNGGEAWVRLSWVLGFKKLGFEVYWLEQIEKNACTDAEGTPAAFEQCVNRAYFAQVVAEFGLTGSAALIYDGGAEIHGATRADLLELAGEADLLVNISGHLRLAALVEPVRRKAYIDIDPGFTQVWHSQGLLGGQLRGYDHYFTIGENIGHPDCPIPTDNVPWRPVRQPVVLDHWPVVTTVGDPRFTTVASWRGPYGPLSYCGKTLGVKVHEFRKFAGLPQLSGGDFEIALNIHPADQKDLDMLRWRGWKVVNPRDVAAGPAQFRQYVQSSGAEFSVAQAVYAETRSGWFSDRSVRYLASGKPVLVQDTGLGGRFPVGEGLLTFQTLEEAAAKVKMICGDYQRHCRAARYVAESQFDSDKVLGRLAEEVGIAP